MNSSLLHSLAVGFLTACLILGCGKSENEEITSDPLIEMLDIGVANSTEKAVNVPAKDKTAQSKSTSKSKTPTKKK